MSSTVSRRLVPLLVGMLASVVPTVSLSQTIYAAVWGHSDPKYVVGSSTLHSGLYRSTDRGATWTHLGPDNLKAFSMDAVDTSRGRILYIAAGNGVHRSVDSGATWKIVTDWRMTEVLDVRVDQSKPHRVYAATAFGLWMSDDGGDTWRNPEGPLKLRYARSVTVIPAVRQGPIEARPGIVRVVTVGGNAILDRSEIWTSSDRGRTWQREAVEASAPLQLVDSHAMVTEARVDASLTMIGTWGGGVYARTNGIERAIALEGRRVWNLVVKEY